MKKLLILFLFIPFIFSLPQQEDYFPGKVVIKDSARIGKTLEIGTAIKVTGSTAADSGKVLRANASGQYVPSKLKPWDLGTKTGPGADSTLAFCYDGKFRAASAASSIPWGNVTSKPAVITNIQDSLNARSRTTHNHSGTYEPAITKATGFLQWNGSAWAFLNQSYALSNHNHTGVYEPAITKLSSLKVEGYNTGDLQSEFIAIYNLFSSYQTYDADLSDLADGTLSKSKVEYLQNVTSDIQTQINNKVSFPGFGTNHTTAAYGDHNHSGVYEPAITKGTGFAKWTGAAWSFVNDAYSLSNHNHSGTYAALSHIHAQSEITGLVQEIADIWSTFGGYSLTGHVHTGIYAPFSHTQAQSTITALPDSLLNKYTKAESEARYTPYKTYSSTTAATRGWYRIATSAVNILSNSAIFKIDFNTDSVKGSIIFTASVHNLSNKVYAEIDQISFSTTDSTKGLTGIRVVYNDTTSNNYAYIEFFNNTARACTTKLHIMDATGWNTMALANGSIPAGYTYKQLVYGNAANTASSSALWRGGLRDRYAVKGVTTEFMVMLSDGESIRRLTFVDGVLIEYEDL